MHKSTSASGAALPIPTPTVTLTTNRPLQLPHQTKGHNFEQTSGKHETRQRSVFQLNGNRSNSSCAPRVFPTERVTAASWLATHPEGTFTAGVGARRTVRTRGKLQLSLETADERKHLRKGSKQTIYPITEQCLWPGSHRVRPAWHPLPECDHGAGTECTTHPVRTGFTLWTSIHTDWGRRERYVSLLVKEAVKPTVLLEVSLALSEIRFEHLSASMPRAGFTTRASCVASLSKVTWMSRRRARQNTADATRDTERETGV